MGTQPTIFTLWRRSVIGGLPIFLSISLHASAIVYLSLNSAVELSATGVPEIRIRVQTERTEAVPVPPSQIKPSPTPAPKKENLMMPVTEAPVIEAIEAIELPTIDEDKLNPQFSPTPHYPKMARVRGIEGFVRLRLGINGLGIPIIIELLESSGHEVLDKSAITGLAQWRFQATDATENLVFWTEKTIEFQLR